MCPICAIRSAVKRLVNKQRRHRIFKKMEQSPAQARYVPAVRAGIETYNYRGE